MNRFRSDREAAAPGQHLMRVRIRKVIFDELQELAEEESERTGEHVTVSDLVRNACYNYLLIYEGLRQLENLPPEGFGEESEEFEEDEEDDDWEDDDPPVTVTTNPMLR